MSYPYFDSHKIMLNMECYLAALDRDKKFKEEIILEGPKVLKPAKVGKLTRSQAKAAVKSIMKERNKK